jgi:hypothetical protein
VSGGGLSRWPPLIGSSGAATSGGLAKRTEFLSDTVCLVGEAVVGSLESEYTWRIKRITQVGTSEFGDDIVIDWAETTTEFDKSWDDRLTYTYG